MKNMLKKIGLCCTILLFIASCYEDKGNYDYDAAIDKATVSIEASAYSRVLNEEVLEIKPSIQYNGAESDLSYEWQVWSSAEFKFIPLQQGKDLKYAVGGDAFMPKTGIYNIRLAVINKKRPSDSVNPDANREYSEVVTVNVTASKEYLGLMVLHGDGITSDVGLIDHALFAKTMSWSTFSDVNTNFYSSFNGGNRIAGKGLKVTRVGALEDFFGFTVGSSYVYIFTDQVGLRTRYERMENTALDYSALMTNPSDASGKVQSFARVGASSTSADYALVDNGRIFFGTMYGPMVATSFSYRASPILSLVRKGAIGVVGFDELSKSFIYGNASTSGYYLNKFPNSTVQSVNFNPTNTNADLLHLELRTTNSTSVAVMKNSSTGEQFIVDLNFNTSALDKIVLGKYAMTGVPELAQIKYYAFGGNVNVNYYASKDKVYQYYYQTASGTANKVLEYAGEEITMMKIVKYEDPSGSDINPTNNYQYSNRMLLVATKDAQGAGKLYVYTYDLSNGALSLRATFLGNESGRARFGEIYDADMKTPAFKVSSGGGGWGF